MRELKHKKDVAGMADFFDQTRREAGTILAYVASHSGAACTRDRLLDTLTLIMLRLAEERHRCLIAVHMKVWARGPVQPDLFADLSGGAPAVMRDWLVPAEDGGTLRFAARCAADPDAVFDDLRAGYIRRVTEEAAAMSDEALHLAVAGPESLWHRIATESGYLHNAFMKGYIATSDVEYDPALAISTKEGREEYDDDWAMREEGGMLSE